MSKHEHWPGPWHWENNGQYLTSKSGTLLGIFTEGPGLGHAAEANLRLIAAAPELLEAVKGLQSLIGRLHTRDLPQWAIEEWNAASDAVLRAGGDEP